MDSIRLSPKISPPQCEIYFGLKNLKEICHSFSKKGALIIDRSIADHYGGPLQKILGFHLLTVDGKETFKTREAKQKIENLLFQEGLERGAPIVAVGGGVVTDLVGFTASTYMRGAPLILIPTTLLAMVDAAIGGKTGVDTEFGKNLVGTFYLPKAVFIDPDFLSTLSFAEKKNGLSEILKYGLTLDRSIWEECKNWEKHLLSLIRKSILCKIQVVEKDFDEKGLRRVLNFGHTVGHALELIFHFKMAHGEAVALGCMAESFLSHHLGYLSKSAFDEVLQFFSHLGYRFPKLDRVGFQKAFLLDKKREKGQIRTVLIEEIGKACSFENQYCKSISEQEIQALIDWMQHG